MSLNRHNIKIVSGGQTGVDRAALDAALENGFEAGGWCPEGRVAEDGVIPESYPVKELPNSGYRQRTKKNVIDSDGTLIIYFSYPSGGTKQTINFCINEAKPHILIDAENISISEASKKIEMFVNQNSISVLNIAGPRASGEPRAYGYAKKLIECFLGLAQK